jgi:putative membrane protein
LQEESSEKKAAIMANPGSDTIPGRFEVKATAESHFSWLRTRLSIERTLMSWVRTAVALIGFGFTIVQFFDRMKDLPGVVPGRFPDAPRYLGLMLILCGILALVVSIWEYQWTLRYLWGGSFAVIAGVTKEGKQTPLFAVAIALILVGLFAFFSVLLRFV